MENEYECDTCGLQDTHCTCYVHELHNRITFVEEELDRLTDIVEKISKHIKTDEEL